MQVSSGNREHRRGSFNRNAAAYHEGRPPYPDRVYDVMESIGALGPGLKVLEIGPGTGQATADLLARGATVHAVELGEHLADRLRERLPSPDLTISVGNIHAIDLPDDTFDTAVAATAFHWLQPEVVLPRLAAALVPGGWLVVWWTVFGDPEADTPFRREVDRIYRERMPNEWRPRDEIPRAMLTEDRIAELTQGGHFGDPVHELIRWNARFDRDQVRALFATFPNVQELSPEDRAVHLDLLGDAVDAEGGIIDDPFVTVVYAARSLRR